MNQQRNEINFEINLLPIISLLAVLICFLLLTTIWIQVGTIDIAQAIGAQANTSGSKEPATVYISTDSNLNMSITVKNSKLKDTRLLRTKVNNMTQLEAYLVRLKKQLPDMQTAIVSPTKQTEYKQIIGLLDKMRKHSFKDIGINPL